MTKTEKILRYSQQLSMLSKLKERNLISEEEQAAFLKKLKFDYAAVVPK